MNFFYEAVDPAGKTVVGKMEAATDIDVSRKLSQLGYRAQSVVANPISASAQSAAVKIPSAALPVAISSQLAPSAVAPADLSLATGNSAPIQHRPTLANSLSVGTVSSHAGQTSSNIIMAGNAARVAAQTVPKKVSVPASTLTEPSKLGGVSPKNMLLFFQQLASLVKSGITIYGALDNLAARTEDKHLAQTAREMAERAHSGGSIAEVMAHYPRIYPDHVVGMVRAGELGGFLEIALAEIAADYEKKIALYKNAWIPKALATQALFLLALSQPIYDEVFRANMDPHVFIPALLKVLLFRNLPIAIAIYVFCKWLVRRAQLPQYRRVLDGLALRMPPFGKLQRQSAIASFVRMLRKLYHAGVGPIQAWEGAMNTAANLAIREKFASAHELMQRGSSLPEAFTATGLFEGPIESLILTGQQSGQVVESLDQIADYYQNDVEVATVKSRFMMLRMGILTMLVLGGAASLYMTYSYYNGMFKWIDRFGE